MAETSNSCGNSPQKEFNLGSSGDCERRHCRGELFATNTLRGAAIALCMTVDELEELLCRRSKEKAEAPSESKDDDDKAKISQLRAEVAFLKSENHRLQQEITSQEIALRKYKNSFVIRF